MPGFRDEFVGAGGAVARASSETHVYELGMAMPERDVGLEMWSASRDLFDACMRCVLIRRGVRVVEGARGTDLLVGRSAEVTGVVVRGNDGVAELPATIVIDAMGARSPLSEWIGRYGVDVPVQRRAEPRWYVTATVGRPIGWQGAPDFWLTFPDATTARAGLLSPAGATEWRLSLSGSTDDPIPCTVADVHDFVATLPEQSIAELLAQSTDVSGVRLFRWAGAVWRRYDAVDRIAGLLPMGDSLMQLDPLQGNGMSVALWQAALVRDAACGHDDVRDLTEDYIDAATAACSTAWTLSALLTPPRDDGGRRLAVEDWPAVARVVTDDAVMHQRYVRMWHLLESCDVIDEILEKSRRSACL
jgi:flavin-dependent dehydrogenase